MRLSDGRARQAKELYIHVHLPTPFNEAATRRFNRLLATIYLSGQAHLDLTNGERGWLAQLNHHRRRNRPKGGV
jgi:hypothetical protein